MQKISISYGVLALCLGVTLSVAQSQEAPPVRHEAEPRLVTIAPGTVMHRPAGDFTLNSLAASPAPVAVVLTKPLHIMVNQVSVGEYQRCVAERVCDPLLLRNTGSPNQPAVGVSWFDATAYAQWLSRKTGAQYRLPTDDEWAAMAGNRLVDDGAAPQTADDPARRWIEQYENEAAGSSAIMQQPQPTGSFGLNDKGVADIGGNVWEWTNTCFIRGELDAEFNIQRILTTNCGVRVAQGRHRAYVTDFIKDARGGGCAVGIPPTNLGFRLVRDDG